MKTFLSLLCLCLVFAQASAQRENAAQTPHAAFYVKGNSNIVATGKGARIRISKGATSKIIAQIDAKTAAKRQALDGLRARQEITLAAYQDSIKALAQAEEVAKAQTQALRRQLEKTDFSKTSYAYQAAAWYFSQAKVDSALWVLADTALEARNRQTAQKYLLAAQARLSQGDTTHAERLYQKVVQKYPRLCLTQLAVGKFYSQRQQYATALPYYRRAWREKENYDDFCKVSLYWGICFQQLRQADSALVYLHYSLQGQDSLVHASPQLKGLAYEYLGRAYAQLKQYRRCIQACEQAFFFTFSARQRRDLVAMLAEAHAALTQWQPALQHYQRLLQAKPPPSAPQVQTKLQLEVCLNYALAGQRRKAKKHWKRVQKALKRAPDGPTLYQRIAQVLCMALEMPAKKCQF